MPKLIFDIETVGENFDELDAITQAVLTKWIKREAEDKEDATEKLEDYKKRMSFNPFVGQIVAIGMLNPDTLKGGVYFQAPGMIISRLEENGIEYLQMSEKEMLENFWKNAANYQEFITFNGRSFDTPFLMLRSAINKVKPTKDLLSNRYLNSQKFDAKHVDLFDQLSFYGAVWRKDSLHVVSRAFGIKSPKSEGISGEDVARLFKEKKYLDIAKYNAGDLFATKELYDYWNSYLRF